MCATTLVCVKRATSNQVERREGNMRGTARIDHAIADIPSPHAIGLEEIAHLAADAAAMLESAGGNDDDGTARDHDSVPRCASHPVKCRTSHCRDCSTSNATIEGR